jgi:K+-transporting ATPase c subunit
MMEFKVSTNRLDSNGSMALLEAVNARIAELQKYKHEDIKIPVDLVTASGSGLDPHIYATRLAILLLTLNT